VRYVPAVAALALLAGCGAETATAPAPRAARENPDEFHKPVSEKPPARIDGRWMLARLQQRTGLRRSPGGRIIATLARKTEFGSPRVLHAVARRGRWLEVVATELDNGRRGYIPAANARLYGTEMSIHIDRSSRRLSLRRGARTVQRMRVAVGRPDTPTPLGRFSVTDKLRPKRDDSPYGCCLLALSGKQPRLLEGWLGGDRLAIHATPSTWTIGKQASLGCIRGFPGQVRKLMGRVPLGTPVFVRA
jgi:lipoprotein-anchoring transpeptidase ErfK/SrfK